MTILKSTKKKKQPKKTNKQQNNPKSDSCTTITGSESNQTLQKGQAARAMHKEEEKSEQYTKKGAFTIEQSYKGLHAGQFSSSKSKDPQSHIRSQRDHSTQKRCIHTRRTCETTHTPDARAVRQQRYPVHLALITITIIN